MDRMIHSWIGTYGISALTTSIARCFGNKNAEYIKTPIFSEIERQNEQKVLTEEEKRRKTEQLFMQLKIMGANHKANNKDSSVS